ncbi:hypothetical protein ACFL0M_14650 [Thermodesulfobacteriota bacterium]
MYRSVGWLYRLHPSGSGAQTETVSRNAGGVVGTPETKQHYMDYMFRAIANVQATHANVSVFRSADYVNMDAHTGVTWAEVRKRLQGRKNVAWYVPGANVMGRRTGHNTWTFHWQTVRLMPYDRNALLESLRECFKGQRPRGNRGLQSLTVNASGVL